MSMDYADIYKWGLARVAKDPNGNVIGIKGGTGNINQTRIAPIRLATFGDSTAAFGTWGGAQNAFDQEYITLAAGLAGTTILLPGTNKLMIPFLYPSAIVVASGGISGETTANMLLRDSLAASATRNSIQDVLSKSPDVILFRGGSINDILQLSLAGYATDNQISTIGLRHIAIAYKLASGCSLVIDSGVAGFDAAGGVPPANLVYIRDALVRLNTYLANFYSTTGIPNVVWANPVGVTCDATGAFLSGATGTGDGTHLSYYGQYQVAKKERGILTAYLGNSQRSAYKGTNLLGSLAYLGIGGSLPAGFTFSSGSATATSGTIEQDTNGEVCMRSTVTGLSAGAFAILNLPINIYSGAPAPNISVTSGMKLGFEYDWSVETADASPLGPDFTFDARMDLHNSGTGRLVVDYGSTTVTGTTGNMGVSRLDFHSACQVLFNDVTANLTNATQWRLQVFLPVIAAGYNFRVKNPRIVQLS